jgi:hypothetical protein
VNKHLHFGVVVTSPIEGCHSQLKAYLQRSSSDLKGVFDRLLLFWDAQQQSIATSYAQQLLRPRHNTNTPVLAALVGQVYAYALQKLLIELAKLPAEKKPPESTCTCVIQSSIGLPCYHTIWKRINVGGAILPEDIHPHWWHRRPDPSTFPAEYSLPLLVLNPPVIRVKVGQRVL